MSWRWVVRLCGGFYECGPVAVVIHDKGAFLAWKRVVKWDYRIQPNYNPAGPD